MAVDWYGDELMLRLKNATADMLAAAAFAIEGQTKVNIVNNGQVDTGFMLNSTYAVTPKGSSYSTPGVSATGRQAAPARSPQDGGALVGVAAEYALYQEMRQSFLYRAVEQVAASQGGEIVTAGKGAI